MRFLAPALAVLALLATGCNGREQREEALPGDWTAYGLQVQDLPDSARTALGLSHGVMVVRVRAPASRTRILPGDVIVSVNQREVRSAEEFGRLASTGSQALGVIVRRTDADLYITLPLSDPGAGAGPAKAPRGKPQRT